MRILLWAPFGAGEHYWGPGTSAFRLYATGLPYGVQVSLAHGFAQQAEYPKIFSNTFFIRDLGKGKKLEQAFFLLQSYFWIRAHHNCFDIVHVLGAHEISLRPALWFESLGIPTLCKITGDKGGISGSSLLSTLLGISRRRTSSLNAISGYIAISDEIASNLLRVGVMPEKIHRIPNGVNNERFSPVTEKHKKKLRETYSIPDKFTFLFVGGISDRKRPDLLVSAIRTVNEHLGLDSQLILVGPDRDIVTLKKIKNYLACHQIEKLVTYFDHSAYPEHFYQMADVFCLPSKSEGMANSLLEAMSCGLPSIVTPVSGSVDLIKRGIEGDHVECEEEIIEAMASYIRDNLKASFQGGKARQRVEQLFDSRSVLDRHLNVMKNVIRGRRSHIR